jgi:hypothetical protein
MMLNVVFAVRCTKSAVTQQFVLYHFDVRCVHMQLDAVTH